MRSKIKILDSSRDRLILPGLDISIASSEERIHRAPPNFCIYSNLHAKSVLQFLAIILSEFIRAPSKIVIDLQGVERITASAGVLLFAHTSYIRLLSGAPNLVRIIPPNSTEARRTFVRSGLFRAMNRGSDSALEKLTEEGNGFSSSSNVEGHYFRIEEYIKSKCGVSHSDVVRAVQEVMLNVWHHAYDTPAAERDVARLGKRLWMYVDRRKNSLAAVVYDMGQGIPAGMRIDAGYRADQELIADAMKPFYSRTMNMGRGNGSIKMKAPVERIAKKQKDMPSDPLALTHLLVSSAGGKYIYTGEDDPIKLHVQAPQLRGTLVELSLKLPEGDVYDQG